MDLPAGSSYAVVAAVIKVMMNAPLVETPEEKAELERDIAVLDFFVRGGTAGRA